MEGDVTSESGVVSRTNQPDDKHSRASGQVSAVCVCVVFTVILL